MEKEDKKPVFTLFLLFFPTILIGLIPTEIGGSVWLPLALKVLVAFYQFVVLKNFIFQYYE
jgi:hypothetical protein